MSAEDSVRALKRRAMTMMGEAGGGLALTDQGADEIRRMKRHAMEKARDLGGYSEGVDYMTGAPALQRYQAGRMDTEEEKINWFEKNVGKNTPENRLWGRDPGGRFILTPAGAEKIGVEHKGAPIAWDPVKLDWGDVAEFGGESGPSLAAGTIAGTLTGGLGFLPALVATFGAGYAGKRADEAIESLQGYQRQTPEEIHGDSMMKGAEEAGGEALTRVLRPFGRALLGPHRMPESPWNPFGPARKPGSVANPIYPVAPVESTVDPARIAASKNALKEGFRPSPGQVVGDRGMLYPRLEAASHWLFGDPAIEINKRTALRKRGELMSEAGGQSGARYTSRSAERMGEDVASKVQGKVSQLRANTATASDGLNAVIDDVKRYTSNIVGPQIGKDDAGAALQESIKNARRAFGDEMSGRFTMWGESNPGRFSTHNVKRVAKEWLDSFPGKEIVEDVETGLLDASGNPIMREKSYWKTADTLSPEGVKTLKSLLNDVGDDLDIARMHSLRRTLSEAAYDPDIMPGVPKKIRRDLLKAVDNTLDVTGLRDLNAAYHEGAKKFDDAYILRLTRDSGKAGAVDPENVADFAIRPGKAALVSKIKSIVPIERWEAVRRAHWDQLLSDVTDPDGTVSSAKLNREIKNYGLTLDEAYGHNAAKEVRKLTQELLAVDGRIPVDSLRGAPIVDALRNRLAAQKAETEFVEQNLVKYVTSGNYEPRKLVTALMKPDNSRLRAQAKDIIGEGSPEWDQVKTEVAGRLLDGMIDRAGKEGDYLSPTVTNNGLRKAIDKMGEAAVDDILGPHFARKMSEFSNQLSISLTKTSVGAGAIMTSAIALRPTKHIGKIVELGILQRLTHRPWFIKWMTEGYSAKNLRFVTDNVARAYFHGNMEGLDNVFSGATDEVAKEVGIVPQVESAP